MLTLLVLVLSLCPLEHVHDLRHLLAPAPGEGRQVKLKLFLALLCPAELLCQHTDLTLKVLPLFLLLQQLLAQLLHVQRSLQATVGSTQEHLTRPRGAGVSLHC